jgi:hypothetical protein
MNTVNSINQNGFSVCAKGEENYTTFRPVCRYGAMLYQYDYRYTDGKLFSCVATTLEACRDKRDKWLRKKNFAKLFPNTLQKIQDNKRLTKSEMAYQIGHVEPLHIVAVSWNYFNRDKIVSTFNQMFGTEIE